MKFKVVLHIVGLVNMILAGTMLFPLFVTLFFNEGDTFAFAAGLGVTMATGLALFFGFRTSLTEVSHRHGFVVVALAWLTASFFSSVPFIISGQFPTVLDAVFEAVSGLTTTGASVVGDIEALSHGILFWRSFIHWIGGIGVVVFGLAILPLLGIGGMQIYKAEASVVAADKLAPRVKAIARILVTVYLIISFVLLVFLIISGMGIFDAFNHTFSTIATGGFSTRGESVGQYGNFFIEIIIMIFMVIGAINFGLHYRFFHEGFRSYIRNSEFKFYMGALGVAIVLVAANITGPVYDSFPEALRYASFQVISIMTTTGFSTADYTEWPVFSQTLIMLSMFMGGMAGSTAGAVKCIRVLLLLKLGYREIYKLVHPHAVKSVKLNGKPVETEVLNAVTGLAFLYVAVFVVSTLLISLQGPDFVTSVSSVATCMGGVGPGLAETGPMSNFAALPSLSKAVLILDMLLGRLELYTLIILLVPAFWRG